MLVVLCYIEYGGKVLLLKRNNNPYAGWHALVGGKVEDGEDITAAAERETAEETGLVAVDSQVIALASEVVMDEATRGVLYEYDIALVRVSVESNDVIESGEGQLIWCTVDDYLDNCSIVPTDIDMVKRYVVGGESGRLHYNVVCRDLCEYYIAGITDKTSGTSLEL